MRIAICDDEVEQIELQTRYIKQWGRISKRGTELEVFTYTGAEEFLFYWSEGLSFDLLFTDIKLKNMSGVQLAVKIRESDENMIIVFISGFKNYVFQGYEFQLLRYLLKPIKEKDYFLCLDKAYEIFNLKKTDVFTITTKDKSIKLKYNEIYFFKMNSHYIEINTIKGIYKIKKRIRDIEQELPNDRFIRCHRSYIINLHFVNILHKTEAILDNGIRISISEERRNDINSAFLEYYAKGISI